VKSLDIDLTLDLKETLTVIKDFIKTYVENSNSKGVVLGLSGGVDSAVVAVLCKNAIGLKKVKCLFLPDESTPALDCNHYKLIAKKYKLSCKEQDISKMVQNISSNCVIKPNKYALANIKARARMILLFEYANMTNNLVCGTSNKSEILVGYFTKYGDGGVDIMPIGDLYKTQVWELASFLKIPKEIISKPPTAGLWKGQFDEQELKLSYQKLDILLAGLERKVEIIDIAKIACVKESEVIRIKNMRIKNQHKCRTPLIPKIGIRTPGYDWRSPILEG
jgi:NAD+ synthase